VFQERIACQKLMQKIILPEQAAEMIKDGMTIGVSGFTLAGYPKAITLALAKKIKNTGENIKVNIFSGASVGEEVDGALAEVGAIARRAPYQTNAKLRNSLNTPGEIEYTDQHLGLFASMCRKGCYGSIDLAIIEACAITKEGNIIPSTSVGNVPTYVKMAKKVLIELNLEQPIVLAGMHDIYTPEDPPNQKPIPLTSSSQRIGTTYIPCEPEKIAGIVITSIPDGTRDFAPIDENAKAMAGNIIDFLHNEVAQGRLTKSLLPLQSGVGSIANAVLAGLKESDFENLDFFSEVIQDSVFDLIDVGKFKAVSGTALTPSVKGVRQFQANAELYRKVIVLRPQEISNHPELIYRLGVIAMNTAIEADIFGNINSTHIMGTRMMNGIGGSGDFAHNASISIFMTPSTAKDGEISCIVPMCSHVDHTEHDVSVIVTERGIADLRNTSPRERAKIIIKNCAHPDYQDMLRDYYERALKANPPGKCHTPHIMSEALSWHARFNKTGSMKIK